MGKAKTAERDQSRDLFVNSGLSLKDIAAIVKVNPRNISTWAKEDNWDVQKTARQVTAEKLISGWYGMISKINEEVAKGDGIPTTQQADQISKITDSIQKLSKKQNLSMYYSVLKEFLHDLITTDGEAGKQFGPYMLDFMKRKANQLSNDL